MLREVWLNIGVEKIDTYEGIMIKALLDSDATEMFMDRQMAEKHGFKLQKLERAIAIKNVDYKGHIERMRIDVCDLGKTEVILGIP